ncbi:hypothetical protein TNCV_3488671 [Trichonephila clavipes]|nr:hypothetical protein TNCV_3488671 [Trichonephila clavipes]
MQVTVRFARFHTNFESEHPRGGQMPPNTFPLAPTSRGDLRLECFLENPHAVKARMSSPGFEPRSYGTAMLTTVPDRRFPVLIL